MNIDEFLKKIAGFFMGQGQLAVAYGLLKVGSEVCQMREKNLQLRSALEKCRDVWLEEANNGDGIHESHSSILDEVNAALSPAGASVMRTEGQQEGGAS